MSLIKADNIVTLWSPTQISPEKTSQNIKTQSVSMEELAKLHCERAWSPINFKGERIKANFISCGLLTLDVDNDNEVKCSVADAIEKFKDYNCIISTTRSHQKEKHGIPACDRFRVIIALDKVFDNSKEYEAFMLRTLKSFPFADQSPKDAARIFFASTKVVFTNFNGRNFSTAVTNQTTLSTKPQKSRIVVVPATQLGNLESYIKAAHESTDPTPPIYSGPISKPNKKELEKMNKQFDQVKYNDIQRTFFKIPLQIAYSDYFKSLLIVIHELPHYAADEMIRRKWEKTWSDRDEEALARAYACDAKAPEEVKAKAPTLQMIATQYRKPNTIIQPPMAEGEVAQEQTSTFILTDTYGEIIGNSHTAHAIGVSYMIANHPDVMYDEFIEDIVGPGIKPEFYDKTLARIRKNYPKKVINPNDLISGLIDGCKKRYNSVTEYAKSTKFVKPMLDDSWKVLNNPNLTDIQKISWKKFVVQTAARMLEPGVIAQNILVLHGEQNVGKSKFCKVYTPFISQPVQSITDSKVEAVRSLANTFVLEIEEFAAARKTDANTLKSFISASDDRIRPLYMNRFITKKRQCVFIATTNDIAILKDSTGSRRFFVMECGPQINTDWWEKNRDSIFAEARMLLASGYDYKPTPEEVKELNRYNTKFDQADQYILDTLTNLLPKMIGELTMKRIIDALRQDTYDTSISATPAYQERVTLVMKSLGYVWKPRTATSQAQFIKFNPVDLSGYKHMLDDDKEEIEE